MTAVERESMGLEFMATVRFRMRDEVRYRTATVTTKQALWQTIVTVAMNGTSHPRSHGIGSACCSWFSHATEVQYGQMCRNSFGSR